MAWALLFSVLTEIHWICVLFSTHLIGYEFFRIFSLFGIGLTDIQILFFLYYIRLYLKRVPNFDHDFLGSFLTIWNVFMPLIFGYLQSYGPTTLVEMVQEAQPTVFGLTFCILVLLFFIILVHGLYDFFFQKPTVPQPIFIIENHQNQPMVLNNVAFNPTLLSLKMITFLLLPLSFCVFLLYLLVYFWHNFDLNLEAIVEYFLRIYACVFSPLVFCICNKNVRNFAMKLLK